MSAKDPTVVISGRVRYVAEKSIKVWTPMRDVWMPKSEKILLECDPPLDELGVNDDVDMIVATWWARKEGL